MNEELLYGGAEGMETFGAIAGMMGTISVVCFIVSIIAIIAWWKIFTKAGIAGWKCLIPFYSTYLMYKLAWGNGWMFLCTLIPVIGFVFPIILNFKLASAFGKGTGFAIGLWFLPIIFQPILAFGDAEYIGA